MVATIVFVLLHSPLVGPLTWRAVAARLSAAGHRVTVPRVAGGSRRAIADSLAAEMSTVDDPVVLVGHSRAGPLLPYLAATAPVDVAALIYVDSRLPHPGRSWAETVPEAAAQFRRDLAPDGTLPPWHEWFPADDIAEILPDADLRAEFTAEIPRLSYDFFTEPASLDEWSGPAGYLLLSEPYRDSAETAATQGMLIHERITHHLAMLTHPAPIAEALLDLSERSTR